MFLDISGNKILREEPAATHFHKFTITETGTRIYTAGHNKLTLWEAGA